MRVFHYVISAWSFVTCAFQQNYYNYCNYFYLYKRIITIEKIEKNVNYESRYIILKRKKNTKYSNRSRWSSHFDDFRAFCFELGSTISEANMAKTKLTDATFVIVRSGRSCFVFSATLTIISTTKRVSQVDFATMMFPLHLLSDSLSSGPLFHPRGRSYRRWNSSLPFCTVDCTVCVSFIPLSIFSRSFIVS